MQAQEPARIWPLLRKEPVLVAWAIHIALIPIYVFKSGLPQPGDMFIVILAPMALLTWNGKLGKNARDVFRLLMWFTLWVCFVDYTWAFVTGNFGLFGTDTYLLYPLYYVYNAIIFLVAFVLHRRFGDVFLRLTVNIVTFTIFVQVSASFLRGSVGRATVFFNNPNQLGYYALLAATLVAVTHKRLKLRPMMSAATLLCCGYLAIVSASRAAAGGVAILAALMMFANPRVIVVAALVGLGVIAVGGKAVDALSSSQTRLLAEHQSKLSFFEQRGYDRIWLNKEYMLFGAGEGGLGRFDSTAHVKQLEIHSSAGTIMFSYGIAGTLLFLAFAWRVIRGAPLRATVMLLPPMLYTVAHQGLRFTLLWVLLAFFVVFKDTPATRKRAVAPTSGPVVEAVS